MGYDGPDPCLPYGGLPQPSWKYSTHLIVNVTCAAANDNAWILIAPDSTSDSSTSCAWWTGAAYVANSGTDFSKSTTGVTAAVVRSPQATAPSSAGINVRLVGWGLKVDIETPNNTRGGSVYTYVNSQHKDLISQLSFAPSQITTAEGVGYCAFGGEAVRCTATGGAPTLAAEMAFTGSPTGNVTTCVLIQSTASSPQKARVEAVFYWESIGPEVPGRTPSEMDPNAIVVAAAANSVLYDNPSQAPHQDLIGKIWSAMASAYSRVMPVLRAVAPAAAAAAAGDYVPAVALGVSALSRGARRIGAQAQSGQGKKKNKRRARKPRPN